MPQSRGPQPPGWHRAAQQEVSGRRASEQSFICRSPSSLALPPEPSPTPQPHLWKNCIPRNRSLVRKRLGTAAPIQFSFTQGEHSNAMQSLSWEEEMKTELKTCADKPNSGYKEYLHPPITKS